MAYLRVVLVSFLAIIAFSSCNKLDPSCVHGTWKDTVSLDSVFFNVITFEENGTGNRKNNSMGCNGQPFMNEVDFQWTEKEGVLTLSYKDSVINYCTGTSVHTDSVFTMAYTCNDDGLWLAGITWVKQ